MKNPTITQVVLGTVFGSIPKTKIIKNNKTKNIFYTTPSDDVFSLNKDTLGALFPHQKMRRNLKPIGLGQMASKSESDWYKDSFFSLGKFHKELPITFCRRTSDFDARNYRISFRQNAVEMGLQKLIYTSGKNKRKTHAFLLCFLLTIIGPIRGILRPLRRYLKSRDNKLRKVLIRRMLGIYNGNSVIVTDLNYSQIHQRLQDATYQLGKGTGFKDSIGSKKLKKIWYTRKSKKLKTVFYLKPKTALSHRDKQQKSLSRKPAKKGESSVQRWEDELNDHTIIMMKTDPEDDFWDE